MVTGDFNRGVTAGALGGPSNEWGPQPPTQAQTVVLCGEDRDGLGDGQGRHPGAAQARTLFQKACLVPGARAANEAGVKLYALLRGPPLLSTMFPGGSGKGGRVCDPSLQGVEVVP